MRCDGRLFLLGFGLLERLSTVLLRVIRLLRPFDSPIGGVPRGARPFTDFWLGRGMLSHLINASKSMLFSAPGGVGMILPLESIGNEGTFTSSMLGEWRPAFMSAGGRLISFLTFLVFDLAFDGRFVTGGVDEVDAC